MAISANRVIFALCATTCALAQAQTTVTPTDPSLIISPVPTPDRFGPSPVCWYINLQTTISGDTTTVTSKELVCPSKRQIEAIIRAQSRDYLLSEAAKLPSTATPFVVGKISNVDIRGVLSGYVGKGGENRVEVSLDGKTTGPGRFSVPVRGDGYFEVFLPRAFVDGTVHKIVAWVYRGKVAQYLDNATPNTPFAYQLTLSPPPTPGTGPT